MSWLNGHRNGHDHSHIDPGTGRNKRDKSPNRTRDGRNVASPERSNGRIKDRKASADKIKIERALRKRGR